MCGILGIFPADQEIASQALTAIGHRGIDSKNIESYANGYIGHVLHALVGTVPQPVKGDGILLFNGEIYNWKQLAQEENISCENDTQLLLALLDMYGIDAIRDRLDGVYAFAYFKDDVVTLERDVLGVKPLWYVQNNTFAFASEKKALDTVGLHPHELHPRTTLRYSFKENKLEASVRPLQFGEKSLDLDTTLVEAVKKRIPDTNKVGVLFSGGVDSSLLALLAKQLGAEVTLYVAALDDPDKAEPHDLTAARESADLLDLPLIEVRATLEEVERLLPIVSSRIEDSNVVKVGVAAPLWMCAERAKQDGQRVLLSGLGAEEVFAGYQRHKTAVDINKECIRGLRRMHERDLYRDDVVGMSHTLEIRLPFLDKAVIATGLAIPGEEKIVDGVSKLPLRNAAMRLGLPEPIAMRPKKAAQYGSQFDAAIEKLARKQGLSKSEYLKKCYPVNGRICSLLSSGKDSVYALYTMQKRNYDIVCGVTIESENPHSYMYHTPLISFAKLQADAMGFPLIIERTMGEKEKELEALKTALVRAKKEHQIDGVVSGALYSDYQRSRIEAICEELGLQVFAPLWHLDQEQEVREILDAGFTVVLSRVAADGLDKSWVGRPITHTDVDYLAKKLYVNVAGEGGEFESLVLDGPNFSSAIPLGDVEVVCEKDGESGDVCELMIRADS